MPILLLLLLVGTLAYMWFARRNATLTRQCRWRLDRTAGPTTWRCAACGAETTAKAGTSPRDCLRP